MEDSVMNQNSRAGLNRYHDLFGMGLVTQVRVGCGV